MMRLLKAFAISFSLYSKIPMPQFEWGDKDMKYSLIFFPWVGLVILGLDFLIYKGCLGLDIPGIVFALLWAVVPLLVTGGFHVDGFMDVEDALKSYASPEKKLEIMKDPHIGAFAVIRFATVGLIYVCALILLALWGSSEAVLVFGFGFVIARALSGIGVLTIKSAKKDGMLKKESEVEGNAVLFTLIAEALVAFGAAVLINPILGGVTIVSYVICFWGYKYKCIREFGGVTGDTAGYFVVKSEVCQAVLMAVILCIQQLL